MKARGMEAVLVLVVILALLAGGIVVGMKARGAMKCLAEKIDCGGRP